MGSDSAFGEPVYAPSTSLDAAIAEARTARGALNTWRAGEPDGPARIALCIASLDHLLASLDADPWQTARLEAEDALAEIRDTVNDPREIALAYFARRGEKGETNGKG